jgi:hypothetical protein
VEIKIDAKTVVANEGGFEPHPESYTPRVFAAVWERGAKVYEILQNGQAIPWPCLPILEGFDYWVFYVEHLSDVDMRRAPKRAGFGPSTQKAIDDAQAALRWQQDPVPQADGDSGDSPTWIGEVDGKKYTGLRTQETVISFTDEFGKKCYGLGNVEIPKSGDLSHLPEGSH